VLGSQEDNDRHKYFFDNIIKTAKNKAFEDGPDVDYGVNGYGVIDIDAYQRISSS